MENTLQKPTHMIGDDSFEKQELSKDYGTISQN